MAIPIIVVIAAFDRFTKNDALTSDVNRVSTVTGKDAYSGLRRWGHYYSWYRDSVQTQMMRTLEFVAEPEDHPQIVLLWQCSVFLALRSFGSIPDHRYIKVQVADNVR